MLGLGQLFLQAYAFMSPLFNYAFTAFDHEDQAREPAVMAPGPPGGCRRGADRENREVLVGPPAGRVCFGRVASVPRGLPPERPAGGPAGRAWGGYLKTAARWPNLARGKRRRHE